jgi:protein phosphatase
VLLLFPIIFQHRFLLPLLPFALSLYSYVLARTHFSVVAMVRKASRKTGMKSDVAISSRSNSPRVSAAPSGNAPRRGSRVNELQSTTRRASLLYQVYDSAAVNGPTSGGAPSPSHAAVAAAAAVLANLSGQPSPSPFSTVGDAGGGGGATLRGRTGGRRTSLSSGGGAGAGTGARQRKSSNGPSPASHAREENRRGVRSGAAGKSASAAAFPSEPAGCPSRGTSSDDTVLPRPYAKGGSYAKENPRLIVSEPLPAPPTSTVAATASPASATFRSKAHPTRGTGAVTVAAADSMRTKRKASSRSLLRNASQLSSESESSGRSGSSGGRPRALSLPRTREGVGEVLPRLRPVRGNHGDDLGTSSSPGGQPRGTAGESLRPSPPPSGAAAGNSSGVNRSGRSAATGAVEVAELREVLSAPPTTFSELTTSTSPQQLLRRNRGDRHVGNGGWEPARPRDVPTELEVLSDGGESPRHNNASPLRFVRKKAGATSPSQSSSALLGKEATKKRWNVLALNNDEDEDDNWGDPANDSLGGPASGHPFGHTQLLSSLRPSPAGDAVGVAAVVPASHRPGGSPGSFRLHPSPPPVPDAAPTSSACSSSPAYKFNVVLSSGKTATLPISLVAGSGCVQGMRPTMEDAHFIQLNATHVRGQPVSLMAVLDGHCGRRVADLGAKWLPHYILHHAALGENNALALVEAILQTDREIFHTLQAKKLELEQQRKGGRGTAGRRRRDVYEEMVDENAGANGGSTLIVAAVCGRMLYVACLGDARAVLYDGQTTIAMSEDHKPGNVDESRRIGKCGGFVQFGRVCGILAVSRALGDFEFKFQPSSNSEDEGLVTDFPFAAQRESNSSGSGGGSSGGGGNEGVGSSAGSTTTPASQTNRRFISNRDLMVSNVADVRQLNLTDASAFLLLACDGLWDVLSNEEATEFVRDFLSYTPDVCDPRILSGEKPRPSPEVVKRVLNNCCQKLTEFAVDRGSMDNVSAMVLFFHDVVDTVARFNGRQPPSRESRSGNNSNSVASGASSRARQGRGSVQRPPSSSNAFDLTNTQVKVRNGRVVARR